MTTTHLKNPTRQKRRKQNKIQNSRPKIVKRKTEEKVKVKKHVTISHTFLPKQTWKKKMPKIPVKTALSRILHQNHKMKRMKNILPKVK